MTANTVKNALLRYFRFQRGFPYVATECWDEDVVASDGIRLLCVEVKISWADYRREFHKDKYIKKSCSWYSGKLPKKNNPNRIFFAAPSDLAVKISADMEAVAAIYGVLSVDDHGQVSVVRKAEQIHAGEVAGASLRDVVMRLTSELITMREQVRA